MVKEKVVVIGLGYVGLPLLCAIAKCKQYEVCGYDLNNKKIQAINNKKCPIDDDLCAKDLKEVQINTSSKESILKGAKYYIICVPTPIYEDYSPNYGPVISATKVIASYMQKGCNVIVESTINPGTCEEIVLPELENGSGLACGKDFVLAHCPERINPGDTKWNVYNINRNVGALPSSEVATLVNFYETFIDAEVNPVSSLKVAESTKIVENSFRDMNIAFVNELAKSFDKMEIDLHETINAASNKPFSFLAHWPGCGVGGHCIAVDPYYLIKRAEISGFNHRLLKEARSINNSMPHYTIQKLVAALNEIDMSVKNSRIALLGLSYKAKVGDLRESPALVILEELEKLQAIVNVFEPFIQERNTYSTLEETLENSEIILLATHHLEFREYLNSKNLKKYKIKVLVDGRNILDKIDIESVGINYVGIGR